MINQSCLYNKTSTKTLNYMVQGAAQLANTTREGGTFQIHGDRGSCARESSGLILRIPSSDCSFVCFIKIKDKMKHFISFKSLSKKSIGMGQCQTGRGQVLSACTSSGRDLEKAPKKGNYLIGCSLKPDWLFVIGCP